MGAEAADRAKSPRRSHQAVAARERFVAADAVVVELRADYQVFIHWCQNDPSGYLSPSHTAKFP